MNFGGWFYPCWVGQCAQKLASNGGIILLDAQLVMWKNFINEVVKCTKKCKRIQIQMSTLSSGDEEDKIEVPEMWAIKWWGGVIAWIPGEVLLLGFAVDHNILPLLASIAIHPPAVVFFVDGLSVKISPLELAMLV